jgi:hypothetical protein
VPRAAKPFFIPVVHSPPGAVGHVAAPELPSQEGKAPSRGTRGSTGAPLSGRQSLEPWDTWQRRSSPQQEGEVRDSGTRGSAGAHLSKEPRFGAEGHVVASELTSARRQGPGQRDTWRLRSSPLQGGVVRSYSLHGSVGSHLSKEARSRAVGHVAAPELTSARRRGSELRDTCRRRSLP